LTIKAQEALHESKNIADKYSHQQIDVEHLLLALIEQPNGIVVPILQKIGVDIDQLKTNLTQHLNSLPKVQVGGGVVGQIYLTPRLNKYRKCKFCFKHINDDIIIPAFGFGYINDDIFIVFTSVKELFIKAFSNCYFCQNHKD
ncbi:unnamed protein product, partial [marine sediment metagenome]